MPTVKFSSLSDSFFTCLLFEGFCRVNPDFSRIAYVHLQGIQGRSRTWVPQVPDNAANGRMRFAQRVKIFQAFRFFDQGDKVAPLFLRQIRV